MALIESLGNAISGMLVQQTNIDVISNNIANVNTTGFKSQTVLFKDVFNKTIFPSTPPNVDRGGTNAKQSGLGVTISQIVNNMHQGAIQQDGIPSHVLIQGNGFFILDEPNCPPAYTRDGSFSLDRNSLLVNSDGLAVQGWTADESGTIDNSAPTGPITIPIGQRAEARATTEILYQGNLDASQGTPTSTSTSTLTGDLDATATAPIAIDLGEWVDQSGAGHDINLTMTRNTAFPGPGTEWTATLSGIAAGTGSWTSGPSPSSFTVTFDAGGALTSSSPQAVTIGDQFGNQTVNIDLSALQTGPNTGAVGTSNGNEVAPYLTSVQVYDSLGTPHTMELTYRKSAENTWEWAAEFAAGDTASTSSTGTLVFDSNGQPMTGTQPSVSMTLSDGASTPQTFTLDFTGTSQLDNADLGTPPFLGPNSTLQARTQDGTEAGDLESFSIGQDGVITGFFTNGNIRAVGQLAMAVFANAPGLIRTSGNNFRESPNSGDAIVTTAGCLGGGTILSGATEQSNVDVTQEFTKMIVAQRAFQANSRVVGVSDDLLNESLQILRR